MKKYFKLYNYQNRLLSFLASFLYPLLEKYEKKVKKDIVKHDKYAPIFIIGAPRTGSTILFETLTNELDVLYPNNLSWKFHNNFLFSFILSQKIYKNQAHNCFNSENGSTVGCGWNAPSECGTFWRRWIDIDNKNFYDVNDLTFEQKQQIKEEVLTPMDLFQKPMVFKNLVNGQMIRVLIDIFPNAKFIFVQRDILLSAQSILKAKRKNGMQDNEYWSIKPKNYQELKEIKNPYEQIVKQIYFIEKQIIEDSKLVKKENFFVVNYENLEDDILKIKEVLSLKERASFQKHSISISQKITLDFNEIEKFQYEIEKLYGRKNG